jgi:hypothetical protein
MPWPTLQDYNEALQDPLSNFNDPDLRNGSPHLSDHAGVYRVHSPSGQWAVRCFLRNAADRHERYVAIGEHLAALTLPYTVGFEFVEKGIQVRRAWHPIVKMQWVEGQDLKQYIETNIGSPALLSDLADRWIVMLRVLRKHGIAHGNLHHGTVLICDGDFRLIDYDTMFVPALAGCTSHDVGHKNYQHPGRSENDYGIHIDNFTGWLIYLTLIALSIEPALWARFKGDDHLLFQERDLSQPRTSKVFRSIEQINDPRILKYLPLFRSFLAIGLSAIASPADVIGVNRKRRESPRAMKPAMGPEVQLALFAPAVPPIVRPADAEDTTPIRQVQLDSELIQFNRSWLSERVLLGFYGIFIFAVFTLTARGLIPIAGALLVFVSGIGCIGASLTCSYMSLGEVRSKLQVWFVLAWRRNQERVVRYLLRALRTSITWLDLREARDAEHLARSLVNSTRREKTRIAEVKSTLAAFLDELNARKAELQQQELEESTAMLAFLQSRHSDSLQEGAFLLDVPFQQLALRRFRHLVSWRANVEELARSGPPIILPDAHRVAIHRTFEPERRSVRQSESFAQNAARRKIDRIRANAKNYRDRIEKRTRQQRAWLLQLREWLRSQMEKGNVWLGENERALKLCVAELNRYHEIRLSRYLPRLFGFPGRT